MKWWEEMKRMEKEEVSGVCMFISCEVKLMVNNIFEYVSVLFGVWNESC